MTSPIEPPRRSPPLRRTAKAGSTRPEDDQDEIAASESANLPIPVSPPRSIPPKTPVSGQANIDAQMIGERRGLRGGASVIDQARTVYNKTEWSGSRDRRAPKGRAAKTDV